MASLTRFLAAFANVRLGTTLLPRGSHVKWRRRRFPLALSLRARWPPLIGRLAPRLPLPNHATAPCRRGDREANSVSDRTVIPPLFNLS